MLKKKQTNKQKNKKGSEKQMARGHLYKKKKMHSHINSNNKKQSLRVTIQLLLEAHHLRGRRLEERREDQQQHRRACSREVEIMSLVIEHHRYLDRPFQIIIQCRFYKFLHPLCHR